MICFQKLLFTMSSSYSFCPQSPSFLAMKYLRSYVPHSTTLLPGERYRLHLNMEAKVWACVCLWRN